MDISSIRLTNLFASSPVDPVVLDPVADVDGVDVVDDVDDVDGVDGVDEVDVVDNLDLFEVNSIFLRQTHVTKDILHQKISFVGSSMVRSHLLIVQAK